MIGSSGKCTSACYVIPTVAHTIIFQWIYEHKRTFASIGIRVSSNNGGSGCCINGSGCCINGSGCCGSGGSGGTNVFSSYLIGMDGSETNTTTYQKGKYN